MTTSEPNRDPQDAPWTARDAETVDIAIADICAAGISLPQGLRAAADESKRKGAATMLRQLADDLERGVPVSTALSAVHHRSGGLLQSAVVAASHTPDLTTVLFDILDSQSDSQWHRRRISLQTAYPLLMIAISLLAFCLLQVTAVRSFVTAFEEFGIQLPPITEMLVWWSRVGAWMIVGFIITIATSLLACALLASAESWHRALGALPMVGRLWRSSGHAEATRVISLLLKHRVNLPDAIAAGCDCCSNRHVAQVWQKIGADLQHGATLSHLVSQQHHIPAEVIPFVQWGESADLLDEGLSGAAELLSAQSEDSGAQLGWLLPPLLFGIASIVIVATILSVFIPILNLIQALM